MAIAVDDTTVAVWNCPVKAGGGSNGVAGTSGSFTAPADSLLVVCFITDTGAGITPTLTVTNSGTGLTWSVRVARGDSEGTGGFAAIARALNTSSQTVTVTCDTGNVGTFAAGEVRAKAKCYIVTGHHLTVPDGNVGENSSTTNDITPTVYTSSADASRGFGCANDWNARGTVTSSDTEVALECAGFTSGVALYKAADTATSGSAVTMNFNAAGALAADWNWVAYEVLPAAGGAAGQPAVKRMGGVPHAHRMGGAGGTSGVQVWCRRATAFLDEIRTGRRLARLLGA